MRNLVCQLVLMAVISVLTAAGQLQAADAGDVSGTIEVYKTRVKTHGAKSFKDVVVYLEPLAPMTFTPPDVHAVILKPTLLGFEQARHWARAAAAQGITTVVTSMFESSLGLRVLAAFAAGLNGDRDVAMGLGTASWFTEDVCDRALVPAGGRIALTGAPAFHPVLDRLSEVPL